MTIVKATPLDASSGNIILEGYAATFLAYDAYGGKSAGGWMERIDARAFDKTLQASPDVQLLINHTGEPLARTKSGTLTLGVDHHGLRVRAELDPSDPDVQRLLPKMRRKDMDEMSFAFRVRGQDWSHDFTERTIQEIDLRNGDVSVVNYGMNPTTTAALSEAVGALASLSNNDVLELRKMDHDQLQRALDVLNDAARADGKKPGKYSDVSNFADPGYLDSNGKPAKDGNGVKRYPLNTAARVRNAAARFAQNKGRYSSEQQSAIMGKIKSAAKRFGVKIGDGDSKSLTGIDHIELAHNAAGGTTLVAVLDDGQRVPLPSTSRGSAFKGGPYMWNPNGEELAMGACNDETHSDDCDGDHEGRAFGGKAKPFKKGGGRETDDDDGDDKEPDDDTDDEGRADTPCASDAMGDYAGTDAQGAGDDNDDVDEHEVNLGLMKALESTIVACYKLAEGNDELRKLLSKARWQISEMRRDRATDGADDVTSKLAEVRSMTGDLPVQTMTVDEGLRALAQSGFADMMKPKG